MCGVAGIASWERGNHNERVSNMINLFNHRGPDDEGVEQLEGCCLGHKRLSIIDLSKDGHQPMSDKDKRFWIVFNGEIYGFKALKAELLNEGVSFKSKSDTEVIIEGYKKWGIKQLCKRLSGMFAFALWDNVKHKLILARDRFGEKPLFYRHFKTGEFGFASYSKSLTSKEEGLNLNPEGVKAFLNQGYCSINTPIYSEISAVPPGTFMVCDGTTVKEEKYYTPNFEKRTFNSSSWKNQLDQRIKSVLEHEMVSDVGCSALLSGGVDSSLLAKYAHEINPNLKFFTVKMNDRKLDESPIAKEFAKKLKLNHQIIDAQPISIDEFIGLNKQFSEPLGDSSAIAMYIVSKAVKKHAKVLITGDGGDEMFAGYNTISLAYKLNRYREVFTNFPLNGIAKIANKFVPNQSSIPLLRKTKTFLTAVTKDVKEFRIDQSLMPSGLDSYLYGEQLKTKTNRAKYIQHLETLWDEYSAENAYEQLMVLDLMNTLPGDYIPKVDTSTMAHSIEARSPFLHHEIADYAFTMPMEYKRYGGQAKGALKELLKDKVGEKNVNQIINGKRGFVIPVDKWLDDEWSELVNELEDSSIVKEGYISKKGVQKVVKEYDQKPEFYSRIRYNLVALNNWHKG